jgi:lipopolysaccharide export system protein LptA
MAASPLLPGAAVAQSQSSSAAGPAGRCKLQFENTPSTRLRGTKLPSGQSNLFVGAGVIAYCVGQDVHLRSDSAEYYGDQGVLYLIGNVHYREPRVKVDSRRMTYFRIEERLVAEGDVVAVLPSGTRTEGPLVEYFRAVPGIRAQPRTIATGRPTTRLAEHDATGKAQEPTTLVANVVTTEADSLVYASGQVVVSRTDVVARGDSATMDNGRGFARLMRGPRIEGKGARPFTLSGRVIDLYSHERQLERVIAQDSAHATSEDLTVTSDTIDMRLTAGRLDRAFAWGPSRAHATSPERQIVADSMDILMPGQHVRFVRAVRSAFAQSLPDSTKIITREKDWLSGDTIVAEFDSLPPGDTTSKPRIHRLVANGSARSYYHIASRAGAAGEPSVNYVRGRTITVAFANQEVQTVTVVERAAGLFVEPVADTSRRKAAADTTRKAAPARRPPTRRPRGAAARSPQ